MGGRAPTEDLAQTEDLPKDVDRLDVVHCLLRKLSVTGYGRSFFFACLVSSFGLGIPSFGSPSGVLPTAMFGGDLIF